jgi:hypothetical protein
MKAGLFGPTKQLAGKCIVSVLLRLALEFLPLQVCSISVSLMPGGLHCGFQTRVSLKLRRLAQA